MRSISAWNVKKNLRGLDWEFVRGSAVLSVGMAAARALGLAFSLVLARAFTPTDFGTIQYGITLAMTVAIGTMPFGQHVLARFIGKYKADAEQLDRILSNAWIILAVLFGLTLLVSVPVLSILDRLNVGVLVTFAGVTLFYTYWGMSSGFQAPARLTIAYLGSNIVQIVLVWSTIFVLHIRSPLLALVLYGASYFLPVAILQRFWPLPARVRPSRPRRDVIREIFKFSWLIWVSHAGFMLYSSISTLLLEHYSGSAAVGVYALASTLSLVFLFLPRGIATLLMPQAAAGCGQAHRRLIEKTLVLSLGINGVILAVYLALVRWFVQSAFGPEYVADMSTCVILAVTSIVSGVHTMITAVLVGSGQPEIETLSRGVAVLFVAGTGWLLIPGHGLQGAAIAELLGALGALATYGVIACVKTRARLLMGPEG